MKSFEEFVGIAKKTSFFKNKVSAAYTSDGDPGVLYFLAKEEYSLADLDAFWEEADPEVEFAEFLIADASLTEGEASLREVPL